MNKKIINETNKGINIYIYLKLSFLILIFFLSGQSFFLLYNKKYFIFSGLLFYISTMFFLFILYYINKSNLKHFSLNNIKLNFDKSIILKILFIFICVLIYFYFFNQKKLNFIFIGSAFYFISIVISLFLFNIKLIKNKNVRPTREIKVNLPAKKQSKIKKHFKVVLIIFILLFCLLLYYFSLNNFITYNFKYFILFFITATLFIGILLNLTYTETKENKDKTSKFDFFICGILFLIAFIIRYYKLNEIPPGIPYDTEGLSLIMTSRIFHNILPPFFLNESVYKITSIYNYIQYLWIKLTGNIELQNIRLLSAIIGSLTILVFYFFIKEVFNRKISIIASLFFIIYLPHIIISRIAWLWIFAPFFGVLTFYFLFFGIKRNISVLIGLSGVMTGLGLYFYSSSYVVPTVILFFLLSYNIKEFNKNLKYLLLYLIPLIITIIPILTFLIKDPEAYILQRTSQESIFKLIKSPLDIFSINILIKRYLEFFIALIVKSSNYGYFNYPELPLLNKFYAYLFLIGIGSIIFNWKNYNNFFILLILFIGIFPGVFYLHPLDPSTFRINMIAIAVPVIASIGIVTIWDILKRINNFIGNATMIVVTIIVFLFTSFYTFYIYFFLYPNNLEVKNSFNNEVYEAINSIKDKFNSHKVYISYFYNDVYSFYPYINFFKQQPLERIDFSLFELNKFYNNENKNAFILTESTYHKLIEALKDYYPDINTKKYWNLDYYKKIKVNTFLSYDLVKPELYFITAEIPYDNIKKLYQLNIDCYTADLTKNKIVSDKTNFTLDDNTDFFIINAIIYLPDYDYYNFLCEGADITDVWIDNSKIDNFYKLSKGLHRFKIKVSQIKNKEVVLKWSKGKNNLEQIPMGYIINSKKIFGLKTKYLYHGKVFYEQIEPAIVHKFYYFKPRIPLNNINNYNILWDGYIKIVKDGKYKFNLQSPYNSFVKINNKIVFERKDSNEKSDEIYLEKGKYKINAYSEFKTMPNIFHKMNNVSLQYSFNNGIYTEVPYYMYEAF